MTQTQKSLTDIVSQVRNAVGYTVHPERGMYGIFVHAVQSLCGLRTRKPSLSQYQEYRKLEETAKEFNPAMARALRWDIIRGNYVSIHCEESVAQRLQTDFEQKMRAYVAELRK